MPVIDFILDALGVIENVISASIVALLTYMIMGGWKYVFRAVSFFFDTQLVKLIGTVYTYFDKLIQGTMFNEAVVNKLMQNIYIFIGVIMFFRLMMIVIKYLINPDLIGDAKIGANALIQRVLLGVCGMLFIPTIFDIMLDFQSAVLKDSIIQQIIIPSDMIDEVKEKVDQGGNYIGTYVLAGFLSPNGSAKSKDIKEFDLGIQQGDLSNIDVNEGGFLTQKFKYDYFFFISTLALAYVFYYMLKYCLDIATRFFKMLLYQLLAPVAMVEYMINGSQDGVFKNWLQATIATYFLLFVRVLAIWFVVFVMALMAGDGDASYAGNLLTDNDYFLRAIIIIALIGFMMDLPKLIGQVFGLDLEQEGSASGVLKQVGGVVKGAAIGGLAIGGAAAGGLIGSASAMSNARKSGIAEAKANNPLTDANGNKLKGQDLKDALARRRQEAQANTKANLDNLDYRGQLNNLGSGIAMAALGSNQFTGAVSNQLNSNKKAQEQAGESLEAQEAKKKKQKEAEQEKHNQILAGQENIAAAQKDTARESAIRDITERVTETLPKDTGAREIKANVVAQMFGVPEQMTAEVTGRLTAVTNSGGTVDAGTVTQTVNQVLGQRLDVAPGEVEQRVNQVLANGGSLSTPAEVEQVVNQVIGQIHSEKVQAEEQVINQVVNQVHGTRVNNAVDDATQTVSQKLEQSIEVQKEISNDVKLVTDIEINRDIREQQELGTFMPEPEKKDSLDDPGKR